MFLPKYVRSCMDALEQAGFAAYAVGGCVRDSLLGLTPNDYDLCTDALPEQTESVFAGFPLILTGKQHGTVTVVMEDHPVEITTFRTEGGYRDNRHPDWVKFVPRVEQDLARRDFTVNAMAFSPTRGYADPFGGREDLKNRVLRTVGDPYVRFREDSLRILRGARFAARYRLYPDAATDAAMARLAPLLDNLARERVFEELCKLIVVADADDLLRFAPVLGEAVPELKPTFGFDQRSPHHAYDLFTHIAMVTAAVPPTLPLRWAALLHDIGKVPAFTLDETGRGHFRGHAQTGARMADAVLRRLRAPAALREQVLFLIDAHMTRLEPDRRCLHRCLVQYGTDATLGLLALQQADFLSKGQDEQTHLSWFRMIGDIIDTLREDTVCLSLKDLAVDGRDLMALGLQGRAVGHCLARLLDAIIDEQLPNEKETLLKYVQEELL